MMVIVLRHSSSVMHQIKHRQLQPRVRRARARLNLCRPRHHRSKSNPNSTRCSPWMAIAVYEMERWTRTCNEEGRQNLVSDREDRVRACMLMPNLLLLGVGAEVRLITDSLSTLGCQRRGSIISSRREGEDDDQIR